MPWKSQEPMSQRTEFAMKALQSENMRELCREYGISAKTGYKWLERLVTEGLGGMREKSRRPHQHAKQLEEEEVCRIVRLKERHRHWGAKKLREIYLRAHGSAPSESSFKRVLERCGLTEKRKVRAAGEQGRISHGRKASRCNEVWTVDFKGWWYDREGRCEPLTVRDEYSRYVLELRALPDARTATVQACFAQLFANYGLPEAIRSDNGSPFASANGLMGLSRLSVWWLAQGVDLERSRPACPQDNGGHERMHRDIAREVEGAEYEERQAALEGWRREYNEERPHEALGMRLPQEVYERSERRWAGPVEELAYAGMATRRVRSTGHISYGRESIFVSQALAGWDVGLKPAGADYAVYFAQLQLGILEVETAAFQPVLPTAEPS
jgi:putative transposase